MPVNQVEIQKRIDYFRKSVRLDSLATVNDKEYNYTDEDLLNILEYVSPTHVGKSFSETPNEEFYFVLLLAKREIYNRLATTSAPFYPLEAEGASLKKNIRFDHYIKLVEVVTKEYNDLYDKKYNENGEFGQAVVKTTQAKIKKRGYEKRYYDNTVPFNLELLISGITTSSINLDWNKYSSSHGGDFLRYEVFMDEEIIYDEYDINPEIKIKPIFVTENIHKTKLRLNGLKENTPYYILVRVINTRNIIAYKQDVITTLKTPEPPIINGGGS